MSGLEDVVLGRQSGRSSEEESDTFAEGRVKAVFDDGVVFTIEDWDDGSHEFGPAPWARPTVQPTASGDHGDHTHAVEGPVPGDRCLVLFVGSGVDTPWVLGWWPR